MFSDDYDPRIASLIEQRPSGERPVEMIRNALVPGLRAFTAAEQAALLTREPLGRPDPRTALEAAAEPGSQPTAHRERAATHPGYDENELRTRVIAAACVAALTTAILSWAENDGIGDLADIVDEGLSPL